MVSFIAPSQVCFLCICNMVIKAFGFLKKTSGALSSPGHLLGSEIYFQLHGPLPHSPLPEDSDFKRVEL